MFKNDKDNKIVKAYLKGSKNNYLIENENNESFICSGGNSHVYRVFDESGKVYAAKVSFFKNKNTSKTKRFNSEISIMQRLNHKNIISIVDFGTTEEGNHFYIMPIYLSSLREYIKINKLSKIDVIELFLNILDGLIYLEKNKIIHRDLKPENILINDKNDIVISDFGIYKETNVNSDTKSSEKMGNFKYASPEQRHYEESGEITIDNYVNHKSDMYSICLMMAEFLKITDLYVEDNTCFITYILNRVINVERKKRFNSLDVYYLLNIYLELLKNKDDIKSKLIFDSKIINRKNNQELRFTDYDLRDWGELSRIICINNFIDITALFDKNNIKISVKNIKDEKIANIKECYYTDDYSSSLNFLFYKGTYNFNNEILFFSKNNLSILHFDVITNVYIKTKILSLNKIYSFDNVGKYIIDLNKYKKHEIKNKKNNDGYNKNKSINYFKENYHRMSSGDDVYTLKGETKKISSYYEGFRLKQEIIIIFPELKDNKYNMRTYFIFDRKKFELK